MLSTESVTGGEGKLVGSMFLIEATKLEDVREKMEQDVYWKTGVVREQGASTSCNCKLADRSTIILHSGTSPS